MLELSVTVITSVFWRKPWRRVLLSAASFPVWLFGVGFDSYPRSLSSSSCRRDSRTAVSPLKDPHAASACSFTYSPASAAPCSGERSPAVRIDRAAPTFAPTERPSERQLGGGG